MCPSKITGYAALAKGQPLELFTYPAPELGEHDVRVEISHCGLCYTDIQAIDDYYRITKFPFVPGHEVVGHVSEIGTKVSTLQVGERVGIGWQGRSCNQCEWCDCGEVTMCLDIVKDAAWKPYGGFASSIIADENFTYRLPEGMPSEYGAVFMCAGITVFAPLQKYATPSAPKIGIIGVGGLGHLAIQFAKAFGYEVTAISSSAVKEVEALSLGADHFLFSGDEHTLAEAEYYFDLLLCTAHGAFDWETLLDTLKKRGILVMAGFADLEMRPIDLIAHELTISGSFLGKPSQMREMLSFATAHRVKPMIEVLPMTKINAALERLKSNQVRYRMVLENDLK